MNFLAHIYLSGNSDEILIGNFIGDYVKGKDYLKYPAGVQKGIFLHRDIDQFTDKHPSTKTLKKFVKEKYGKFSGIVIDIFYDHFLAANWDDFSDIKLNEFVKLKYDTLGKYYDLFPYDVKNFFPYFLRINWLEAYSTIDGLGSVLRRMAYRTSIPEYSAYATSQLQQYYPEMLDHFFIFIRDVIAYVGSEYAVKFT